MLRDVQEKDIPIFFEFLQSSRQQWQAAFTPEDPSNFDKHLIHWQKIFSNPTVLSKTILLADQVVGHVGRWMLDGIGQVTFWLGEEFEGKHIASTALARYLEIDSLRPLQGRCAFDNLASARVLEKNGFRQIATDSYFANARGEEITELVFQLP